ncbi:MAG: hypothetical protein RMK18_12415 [Armatimonadota bacterium]|nr:hypothetical protein [Armatimonadota bacterium]MDW8026650.1 hypothetical protein [Armatimonadota bacterium]
MHSHTFGIVTIVRHEAKRSAVIERKMQSKTTTLCINFIFIFRRLLEGASLDTPLSFRRLRRTALKASHTLRMH